MRREDITQHTYVYLIMSKIIFPKHFKQFTQTTELFNINVSISYMTSYVQINISVLTL